MADMTDILVNASKFHPDAAATTLRESVAASKNMPRDPPWWEVGIVEYRRRSAAGELLYKPRRDEKAQKLEIPSREADRSLDGRVFLPRPGRAAKGVFMHVHGGGWCVFGNDSQDELLGNIASTTDVVVISINYRLAPEYPFPAGPEDCYDAATWLVNNAQAKFGVPLSFVGGSSSGAHYAALTAFHLRAHIPSFHLKGLLLLYGVFDLTYSSPSIANVFPNPLTRTTDAFLPNHPLEARRDPSISPMFVDLRSLTPLPPALFICGTGDLLADDTAFFSIKWQMAGAKAVVKFFPGAMHGFVDFEGMPSGEDGRKSVTEFLNGHD